MQITILRRDYHGKYILQRPRILHHNAMIPPVALLIPAVFAWAYFHIIIHEAAHVIVGNRNGFGVDKVQIGAIGKLFSVNLRGVNFSFHVFPTGGLAFASKMPEDNYEARAIRFYSSGLIADIVLLAILLGMLYTLWPDLSPNVGGIGIILLAYQGFVIIVNAWPSDILSVEGNIIPNDGKLLSYVIKGQRPPLPTRIIQSYLEAIQRYEPSVCENDLYLKHLPHAKRNGCHKILTSLQLNQLHEAMEVCEATISDSSLHIAEKAYFYDQVASTALQLGTPEQKLHAKELTDKALELLPESATLKGTLGSLMIENGQCGQGLALLLPLTEEGNEPINRSISALYIAKAYAILGRPESSEQYISLSRKTGYKDQLTLKLELELDAALKA